MPKDDKLEHIIGDYYTPGERQFLLYRYLLENTCEGHVAPTKNINKYLAQYGIEIERKARKINVFSIVPSVINEDEGLYKIDVSFEAERIKKFNVLK